MVVYIILGHPLHFPLVTFDKIRSKSLIEQKFTRTLNYGRKDVMYVKVK